MAERFVPVVTLAGAVFFIGTGAWAFLDPSSFYDQLATLLLSLFAAVFVAAAVLTTRKP